MWVCPLCECVHCVVWMCGECALCECVHCVVCVCVGVSIVWACALCVCWCVHCVGVCIVCVLVCALCGRMHCVRDAKYHSHHNMGTHINKAFTASV